MVWPIRRTLAQKLFGIRRRSRTLRHVLETHLQEAVRAQSGARHPEDAAHHAGRRAAYQEALAQMAGSPPAPNSAPPSEPGERRAWQRGHDTAAAHAAHLLDRLQ